MCIRDRFDSGKNLYSENIRLSNSDFLWLYTKYADLENSTGCNSFMEQLTSGYSFQKCSAICLPFICAPPSDKDTIYTSLLLAQKKAEALNLDYMYVTFDQPLYIKALEIILTSADARLKNVIPILGGFHLLMSYMGSIGNIMGGSGIDEILSQM